MMDSVLISQGIAWEVRRKTPKTAWLPIHPTLYEQIVEVAEDTVNEQDSWDGAKFIPKPPPPLPPTAAERVDNDLRGNTAVRALMRALAQRFNMTEAQMVDAIKARAD